MTEPTKQETTEPLVKNLLIFSAACLISFNLFCLLNYLYSKEFLYAAVYMLTTGFWIWFFSKVFKSR